MKIGKRKAAALLALAVFGVLGTFATANASTGVGGYTILTASTHAGAHKCIVIGSDSQGHQGVLCADIVTSPTSSGYQAIGQVEAYCQTEVSGVWTDIQCAHVSTSGRFSNAAGGSNPFVNSRCGHQFGPCAVGRNIWPTTWFGWESTTGCDSNPKSSFNVWTSVDGGELSGIELPGSDKWVYLTTGNDGLSQSTGHYYICW